MNKYSKLIDSVCLATGTTLTIVQTNELFQLISLIITCIAGALSVAITTINLVGKVSKWYKKAKSDGKITNDEIDEGIDIVENGLNDIKDEITKSGKEKK